MSVLWATGCGLVLAWLVAAHLHREAPHPPQFVEERDLLPLPPPSDNGWTALAERSESSFEPAPPEMDLLRIDEGPPRLAEWRAMRDELERWEVSAEARAELEEVLARPRFAIVCDALEPCDRSWLSPHRFATGLALKEAARGADDAALTLAESLLRVDLDALVNARSFLAAATAQAMMTEAIELVSLLAAILDTRESDALSGPLSERLDALVLVLDDLEPERWTLDHALIGDAIWMRRAIDSVAEPIEGWRWGAPDLARTARLLDEHIDASIRYARDPLVAPRPESPEAGRLWRALDPVGTRLLDVLHVNAAPGIDHFMEKRARAADRIAVARGAVVVARSRLERAVEL